jgi:ABC-2 type transport system ATP-binding protein
MENLVFMADMYEVPRSLSKDRAAKLLAGLQLSDKTNTKAKALSGGMKRRLNLAMALIHDPEIVLLDEPSPGLDPQTRLVLWDYIQTISKKGDKKTVILTTHAMEEADRLSDRVAIIDQGKLKALDTPEGLKNSLGEGDVVEMRFSVEAELKGVDASLSKLEGIQKAELQGSRLIINSYNAVTHMPKIFETLPKQAAGGLVDLKLRKNTLEDVFISLTGRALREENTGEGGDVLGHLAEHLIGMTKHEGKKGGGAGEKDNGKAGKGERPESGEEETRGGMGKRPGGGEEGAKEGKWERPDSGKEGAEKPKRRSMEGSE